MMTMQQEVPGLTRERRGAGRRLAALACVLGIVGMAFGGPADNEWLMKLNPTNQWKVTQVYPGLSATVRLETVPSAAKLTSFSRLAVLRENRVLGFVRVVSPSLRGFSVGSLGRTLRVSLLRHGDRLHAFTLETDTQRSWERLSPTEQKEVSRLIALLGHENYSERESATAALKTRDRAILSRLRAAMSHEDPEVRARVEEVGRTISARDYVVPDKLVQVLQRKSGREKPLTRQGFLGVSIADVQQGRLPGALITQVLRDSPAERAGLRLQDVIAAIDDQVLDDSTDVLEIISAKEPGSVARLKILRGGEVVQVRATLAARPIPLP